MTGFVYAIGDSERVKIGWSRDPMRRSSSIKTDCSIEAQLLGLVPATRAQEAEAHKLLAHWRIQGEWFRHEDAVAAFVAMLPRPKPKPVEIPNDAHPLLRWRYEQTPRVRLDQLANVLGTTKTTLSQIENRKRQVSVKLLSKLVTATGIAPAVMRPDIAKAFAREAAE